MVVSIAQLADALRVDSPDAEETAVLTVWLEAAQELITARAPGAPETVADAAIIKAAGYWYDQPMATRSSGFANAMTNSGALHLLGPWIVRRAAVSEPEPAASEPEPEAQNGGPLGLRLLGTTPVDILAAMTWTATGLRIPRTPYFAHEVIFPSPADGITTSSGIVIVGNSLPTDTPITLGTSVTGIPGIGFGVDPDDLLAMTAAEVGTHHLTVWEV